MFRTEAFRQIKAVAMDVDGVLTDGTFCWGPDGTELKRFCFADSTGITLAREAGLFIALVSGESSPDGMALVKRYAEKLKITDVSAGCHDKAAAVRDFAASYGINLAEVCFIGDDVIDLEAMSMVGLAVAPADAHASVRDSAAYVTGAAGGRGAVREVLDIILTEHDRIG